MNGYLRGVLATATCVAGVSIAACSAGITTARPGATSRTVTPHTASPTATPSPSAAVTGGTVKVNAPIGTFPIPPGGQVQINTSCPKDITVMLSPVTPTQAESFYDAALPQAGYKITSDTLGSDPNSGAPKGLLMIQYTGHGYAGMITGMIDPNSDASKDPSIGSLPEGMRKNLVEILMNQGDTFNPNTCTT